MLSWPTQNWLTVAAALYAVALVAQTLPIPPGIKAWCARVSFAIDRVERDPVVAAQLAQLTATNATLLAKVEALTTLVRAVANDTQTPTEPTTPAIPAAPAIDIAVHVPQESTK
jgi:hypothetical protein